MSHLRYYLCKHSWNYCMRWSGWGEVSCKVLFKQPTRLFQSMPNPFNQSTPLPMFCLSVFFSFEYFIYLLFCLFLGSKLEGNKVFPHWESLCHRLQSQLFLTPVQTGRSARGKFYLIYIFLFISWNMIDINGLACDLFPVFFLHLYISLLYLWISMSSSLCCTMKAYLSASVSSQMFLL